MLPECSHYFCSFSTCRRVPALAANSGKWSRETHYSKERGERPWVAFRMAHMFPLSPCCRLLAHSPSRTLPWACLHARLERNGTASGSGSTRDASSGLYILDTKLTSILVSQIHGCFQPARGVPPCVNLLSQVPNHFFLSLELSGVHVSISQKKRSWAFYFAEEEVSGLVFPLWVKRPWPWFIISFRFLNHTQHTVNTWKVDLGIPCPLR